MQITEKTITLMDGVDENGIIRVKRITRYTGDDGTVFPDQIWRTTLQPGDTFDDPAITAICAIVHTPEVIVTHQEKIVALQAAEAVKVVQ
jgi:hypothetical protein